MKQEDAFGTTCGHVVSPIMTAGGMAMLTRMSAASWFIKYEQTQQARAIAEAGPSKTIANLITTTITC